MTNEEMKQRIEAAVPTLSQMLVAAVNMIMNEGGDIADFPPTAAMTFKPQGSSEKVRISLGVEVVEE